MSIDIHTGPGVNVTKLARDLGFPEDTDLLLSRPGFDPEYAKEFEDADDMDAADYNGLLDELLYDFSWKYLNEKIGIKYLFRYYTHPQTSEIGIFAEARDMIDNNVSKEDVEKVFSSVFDMPVKTEWFEFTVW